MKKEINAPASVKTINKSGPGLLADRLVLLALLVILSSATAFAQAPEEDALKAAIKKETESYFQRNSDAWQNSWSHDTKATRTVVANNYFNQHTGWDHIKTEVMKNFKENPKPVSVDIQNENFIIHNSGNLALLEYDQTLTNPATAEKSKSREHRTLVKTDGQWKIVSQITHLPATFAASPAIIESNLNASGYYLLEAKRVSEAIEVFKLNTRLFPQSANTFDSLGEAFAIAGDKKSAITNYEKSIVLNPKNETGKVALAKLKEKTLNPK